MDHPTLPVTTMRHKIEIEMSPGLSVMVHEDAVAAACLPEGNARAVTKKPQSDIFLVEFDTSDEADDVVRKFASGKQFISSHIVRSARVVLDAFRPRTIQLPQETPARDDMMALTMKSPSSPFRSPTSEDKSSAFFKELQELRRELEELRTSNATLTAELKMMQIKKQEAPIFEKGEVFQRKTITMQRQIAPIANRGRGIFLTVEACLQLGSKRPPSVDMLEAILLSCPVDIAVQLSVNDILEKIPRYSDSMRLLETTEFLPSELNTLEARLLKHELPIAVIILNESKREQIGIYIKAFKQFVVFDCHPRRGNNDGPHFECDDSMTLFTHRLSQLWQPALRGDDFEERLKIYIFKVSYSDALPAPDYRYFERRQLQEEQFKMRQEIETLRKELEALKERDGADMMPPYARKRRDESSSASYQLPNESANCSSPSFAPMSPSTPTSVMIPTASSSATETFICVLCKSTFPMDQVFRLSTCHDRMCRKCARTLLSREIQKERFPLQCPACRTEIIVEDAELVLEPNEVYKLRLAEIARETQRLGYAAPQPQSRRCPTCQTPVRRSYTGESRVFCYTCGTKFCFICGEIFPTTGWVVHPQCPSHL